MDDVGRVTCETVFRMFESRSPKTNGPDWAVCFTVRTVPAIVHTAFSSLRPYPQEGYLYSDDVLSSLLALKNPSRFTSSQILFPSNENIRVSI